MSDEQRHSPLDELANLLQRTGRSERPAQKPRPPAAAAAAADPPPAKADDTWPVAGKGPPGPADSPFEPFRLEEIAEELAQDLATDSNAAAPEPAPMVEPVNLTQLVARIDRAVGSRTAALPAPARGAAAVIADVTEPYITFVLLTTRCAVPMRNVLEIGRLQTVTSVPNTPDWIVGVTNVRGEIVSVTDLRLFLGLPRLPRVDAAPMLLVRSLGTSTTSIALVDKVLGITRLAPSRIRKPAGELSGPLTAYLLGVAEHEDHPLALLDLERLVASGDFNLTASN